MMARKLKIKVEATGGSIDRFRITVGDQIRNGTGTQPPSFSGSVADENVTARIEANGSDPASYKISLDLENILSGQSLELSLVGGASELSLVL